MQADCIMGQYSYVVNKSPTRANLDLMSGPQADASVSSHLKSNSAFNRGDVTSNSLST